MSRLERILVVLRWRLLPPVLGEEVQGRGSAGRGHLDARRRANRTEPSSEVTAGPRRGRELGAGVAHITPQRPVTSRGAGR